MTIHIQGATPPDAIAMMLGVPRFHSAAIMRAGIREQAAMEIERLINFLDATEGDPDLEDNGDREPSLGGVAHWTDAGPQDDLEEDESERGETIMWTETEAERGIYYLGHWDDEEGEESGFGDGGGMTEDLFGEPDLGWSTHINQELANGADGWNSDGEPLLGWSENHGGGFTAAQVDSPNDGREQDAGDEGEMDDDREWSLGFLEGVDQHAARLSWGHSGDLEA